MSRFNLKLCLSLLATLLLSACASEVGHYVPDVKGDSGAVRSVANTGAIHFINNSAAGLRDLDWRKTEVDLNEVTQALIDAMSEEWRRQGGTITSDATKTVSLDMKGIVIEPEGGGMTFASTVFIDVVLGNGESFFVESKRSSYGSAFNVVSRPTAPLDAAVSDAVELILNEPRLRAYVEQGD